MLALLPTGCNGVFYQPDHAVYGSPADEGLRYSSRTWDTDDGERLQAWVIEPPAAPIGVVLHFHGNAENRTSHFGFVSWLAHRGYTVVAFDYRGYDGSSGRPGREGLYKDGLRMLRAVCLDFPGPRFLVAQSLGGSVLVPALADFPDPHCYQAMVIESSFASYREMAVEKLANFGFAPPFRAVLRHLVSVEHEPIEAAPRVTLPALVIHGDQDGVVPIEQGLRLFNSLGSEDKAFMRLPGEGHTPSFGSGGAVEARVMEFFRQQAAPVLGGAAATFSVADDWGLAVPGSVVQLLSTPGTDRLEWSQPFAEKTADDAGNAFFWPLPEGSYAWRVLKHGFAPKSGSLVLAAGERCEVNVGIRYGVSRHHYPVSEPQVP